MRRREFISLVGGAAVGWPLTAQSQQAITPTIGLLSGETAEISNSQLNEFRKGLADTGFVDGRDVVFAPRWANNDYNKLPALAGDLVQRRVNLIAAIAYGSTPAALAAKAATTSIPIVFAVGTDPIKTGIVNSLNRPSGNVTGATFFANELAGKRLGLLHQLIPRAALIGVLMNPKFTDAEDQLSAVRRAADELGLRIYVINASTSDEIDAGFDALVQQQTGALFVGADPFLSSRQNRIIDLAARHSIPAIYDLRQAVAAGGLISYAASSLETHRQAGIYAGRILKGEKPGDLPVLQPTKFELVINLKTAKALDLTIPPTLLATADEVIE